MVLAHERILNDDKSPRFVRRDVYDRDMHHLGKDVAEINDSMTWALRLVVTQFLVLIVTIVVVAVTYQGG